MAESNHVARNPSQHLMNLYNYSMPESYQRDTTRGLPYDPYDRLSILDYAEGLLGKTLRDFLPDIVLENPHKRKGSFGNHLEQGYFHIPANSRREADFAYASLELKSTPLKQLQNGELRAKERLVLGMINFFELVDEQWESSTLLEKTALMLLVAYLYEKDKNPIDYRIVRVLLWGLQSGSLGDIPDNLHGCPTESDWVQFRKDWEFIRQKVREGKAHEISSGDTVYLEACPKGRDSNDTTAQPNSNAVAMRRAWALKASYMSTVLAPEGELKQLSRRDSEQELDLLELVKQRFTPYFGRTLHELAADFGYDSKADGVPKNLTAIITNEILGLEKGEKLVEFAKAGIAVKPKTIRLQRNGKPKEAMSFPAFDYTLLADTDFEDSDFYQQITTKYLFVIYLQDDTDQYRLSDTMFWQMPDKDLPQAKACYDTMRQRTKAGQATESVKASENPCVHVRPHGRNREDTRPAPDGKGGVIQVVKKCFWLNTAYLQSEIARHSTKQIFGSPAH
ncbi:putative type II restriction endonuclease [Mobiluncus mulieris FB024-16]|nr:putative type II restriction endonuclease [Mobiluncus mulieris FB024-16]